MKIEQKEKGKVKITLDIEDMERYDITFSELDYNRIDTKRIVWELLSMARSKTGFDFSNGSLLVEAFPSQNGGCILYFTSVVGDKKGRLKLCRGYFGPYIFQFFSCEDMIVACKEIKKIMGLHILKSELYLENDNYFLAVYAATKLDCDIKTMLLEYGNYFGDGRKICYLYEHSKLITAPKAIERMASL
jgi:negative regulator of genetic competence, sporulation and motility